MAGRASRADTTAGDGARIGIGVDFGTTNSTAALFDGECVQLVPLERGEPIMASATYIDNELQTCTGQEAIDRYIADNTGRTVEMVPEVVGVASMVVGDPDPEGRRPVDTLTKKVYGASLIDSGLQGRLFRGTKRLLGNANVRRLMVFNQPFRLVAVITPILLRIRHAIASASRIERVHAHAGHPVNFEGRGEHKNKLALTRLGEAYGYAGIKAHEFFPEPLAATVSYLHDHSEAEAACVLTVDFGGGTLDFSILRRHGSARGAGFDVIATHGVALGGDHIDQRLFRKLLFPLLGKGELWRRRGFDKEIETRFPFEEYEDLLLNWPITYVLNQNKYTAPVMDCIDQRGPSMHKFRRLRELIKQNYSYVVFQAIRELKARLSEADTAVLDIPEIDVQLRVTRAEFEAMIADLLDLFRAGVDEIVTRSGLDQHDIDLVVRTGGSSLIPAVREILEHRFPGRVVDHDPFTSVAAGLALADYYGYHYSTP